MAALTRIALVLALLAAVAAADEVDRIAKVLRRDPTDRTAWDRAMEVRRAALDDLDVEKGRRILALLAEVYHKEAARYRTELGWLLLDAGRIDEAAGVFEELNRDLPGEPRALYGLAAVANRRGRFREALRRYQEVAAAGDDYWAVLMTARIRATHLGDYEGAEAALDEAHRLARKLDDPEVQTAALEAIEQDRMWVEEQIDRRAGLEALVARQSRLLLAIGAGWAVLLAVGFIVLRRL